MPPSLSLVYRGRKGGWNFVPCNVELHAKKIYVLLLNFIARIV
jgi:hypothetical protein